MVNNIKFNDPARFRYRIGALYDSSYVEKLFPELKFKLDIHENVASKEVNYTQNYHSTNSHSQPLLSGFNQISVIWLQIQEIWNFQINL